MSFDAGSLTAGTVNALHHAKLKREVPEVASGVEFGKPAFLFDKFPHRDVFITDKDGTVK